MNNSAAPSTSSERAIGLGLFVISAAILTLEVLQIRILSVQMWYHHAYMVVTMTLLGFAAAGTVVTVRPGLARDGVPRKLAWCSTLFGVSVIVAYFLLTTTAERLKPLSAEGSFGSLSLFYSIMVLPYFFGGLVVTIALTSARKVHKRYFVNLLGSALGAWVFVAAITPLGGERLLALSAAMGPLAGLCFLGGSRKGGAFAVSLLALAACAPVFLFADTWLRVEIGSGKLRYVYGEAIERRWTPLACIDLIADNVEKPEKIHILQDGGAGTFMLSKDKWRKQSPLAPRVLAYVPHLRRMKEGGPPPEVMAIGIGGGADLRVALDCGAKSVLGVEINDEIAKITREDYADFNGGFCREPNATLMAGEGRSTLRRLDEKFDLIQISGADTYTAANTGSFVLSESYLYSSEAIRDYFDHLKPGGTLGILRFYDDPPREMLRLLAMVLEELRRRGIEKPSRHAVMIRSAYSGGSVFSLEPVHAEDIAFYRKADQHPSGLFSVLYVPGLEKERTNEFTELALAFDAGAEEEFYEKYPVNIRPVTDDSPFFYNFHRLFGSWEEEPSSFAREFDYHFPVAPKILSGLLLQVCLLTLVLVILPLVVLRRGGLRASNAGRHLLFFLGVGVGFMFLEISTIQRFALFLGHPTYSVTVVLFCFLFFAGLGSLWSGRLAGRPTRGIRAAALLLTAVILVLTAVLGTVQDLALHLSLTARVLVAIALLAPMNFLMGIPFPLALSRLQRLQPKLVPWALGANGGASVIGSILCVIIAMESGFTAVSLLSAAVYLLAMAAATTGPLSPAEADG